MIIRDSLTDKVDLTESKIYRKDGLPTTAAFNEDFVTRKLIKGDGYAEYSRLGVSGRYVVKGFAPKFFCEEFDDRRDADKFWRNLK